MSNKVFVNYFYSSCGHPYVETAVYTDVYDNVVTQLK